MPAIQGCNTVKILLHFDCVSTERLVSRGSDAPDPPGLPGIDPAVASWRPQVLVSLQAEEKDGRPWARRATSIDGKEVGGKKERP
ncbi:hypothetical protein GLAREA_04619 [Glarea lozoyensis ATCC 20868]|uniref:Uncharacterized protein n=1 Tax=Glarea lozoyensis (strain ATCC 20868 / MF5171) TaxID=1116229 RepID=S3DMW6_GLAL2|nr:uncharacterized protein GLAREA_04619 [Glarea lozoyensis ATCC 20868]EPE27828.1 hypothetical protein GLAREA_04619 [Glarea lozoyensis ATCC 20868]